MTPAEEELVRSDYLEWSGGSPPDLPQEIFLYVEFAAPGGLDARELTTFLSDWALIEQE